MNLMYPLAISFVVLFSNCVGEITGHTNAEWDTAVTRHNTFSALLLDSMSLEKFIIKRKTDDSSAYWLRNFYSLRHFQFAWFDKDGIEDHARAFWNLHNNFKNLTYDSSIKNTWLHEQMESLINGEIDFNANSSSTLETELQLTSHFFNFAKDAYQGKVNPKVLQWHIPGKKINPMALLDSLILDEGQHGAQWEPLNRQYKLMYAMLKNYHDISDAGGWKNIVLNGKESYQQGDSSVTVLQLKQRLQTEGDYNPIDTSAIFTAELTAAVELVQIRLGYRQNGILDAALVKALNVPVQQRIQQMLINMERMRWMPKESRDSRILVNIPEFEMHVFSDSGKVFDIDIVVGTAAHETVVFNDILKSVVFSPYWNIPRSIVRREVLPGIRRNSNYLASKNMEKTGFRNGLPVIRQKPGANNALGRVKFIFPNSYSIYFHDSPQKSLFDEDKRAFSHGCIRLAEPRKMAAYLLRNQPEWTDAKIDEAMSVSEEKWVTLSEPIPVFISYFTSWIDEDGLLNFREDIYGRDKKMAERLFAN